MKKNILLCLLNVLFCPIFGTPTIDKIPLARFAEEYKIIDKKIYLDPTQLWITDEGLYFFVDGARVFAEKIAWDRNGIYCLIEDLMIDSITDRCRMGHRVWCTRCWGCVVRDCPYHCNCVAWP